VEDGPRHPEPPLRAAGLEERVRSQQAHQPAAFLR
jgi:hypothetical protein